MLKDAYINARVDKRTKAEAQKVLGEVGMTTSQAINLFLKQIVLHKGLPFEVRVPNQETRKAIAELRTGKGERYSGSTKALLQEMIESGE